MIRLALLLSLYCVSVHASTTVAQEDASKTEAKAVMGNVYNSFLKVVPYLYSDENTMEQLRKDPAKKEELLKDLADLSEFFKSARHVEYFDRPGFRPSLETMNSHLFDTINSVKNNNFNFAQKRLSALTSLCISCHTQLSEKGTENAFGTALSRTTRDQFTSDFAYGNYLYLIRQFPDAERFFTLALDEALKTSRSHELYTSLRRIISIHTKISFNYKKASEFTDKYKQSPLMPSLAKETVTAWSKALEKWKNFNPAKVTSIDDFIKKNLSPLEELVEQKGLGDNDISLLIASGVLSKYLNDNPKTKSAPQILYWLSVAERRLSTTYFFTLSDIYLKDCIKKYSSTATAKKCFNLYEENIQAGFTGSSGVDIPPEEKTELVRLKALLK